MRRAHSLVATFSLASLAQVASATMAGATTRAVEVGTRQETPELGVWLPFLLVLTLTLVTMPALLPRLFGQDGRR
jgi:hypothetical protein